MTPQHPDESNSGDGFSAIVEEFLALWSDEGALPDLDSFCRRFPAESAEEIQAVLEEGRFFAPGAAGGPATPLEVATDASSSVSGLVEDGLGGFWLWAVAGDTTSRTAVHAVRLAEMVSDL